VLCEDVEDELGAVEHLAFGHFGDVAQLGGRKFAVEDDHRGVALKRQHLEFRQLALAEDELGVHGGDTLDHGAHHVDPCRACKLAQFFEVQFLHGARQGRHGDEHRRRAVRSLAHFGHGARHLLFEGFDLGHEIGLHPVPRGRRVYRVVPLLRVGGQQVGTLQLLRAAVRVHREHGKTVQPQEEQVHEVFLRDEFRREVGVHQPQAAQATCTAAGAGQFRDEDGPRVAHDDHLDAPLPVDEQTQLSAHAAREGGEFAGLFVGIAPEGGVATL